MSEVPKGWCIARLDELCEWGSGGTPRRSEPSYFGGKYPWITISDLNDGIVTSTTERLTDIGIANSAAKLVPEGAVLVALYGSIGKLGITKQPSTTNQAIACALPDAQAFDPVYLFHYLRSRRHELGLLGTGVTQKNIYLGDIKAFAAPVAPRAEQTRIVAKLEELLSDLDAGVAELKAAQKKLAQYRQSLLKAAVEGALTAEWRAQNPPGETGAQLLSRILIERRARWEAKQLARFKEQGKAPPKDWQKKYPEPVPPDTTDLPALPEGWGWASLGQLLTELTSGSRDWAPYYDRGSSVFVMAQNVRPWRPDFSFKQFVDPPVGHRDRSRSEIRADDLLTTIVGANTGQVCRVASPVESHFVCQSVALMRLVLPRMSEYVNAVLNSEGHGQRQFRAMNYGAGRPHLSFEQLEAVLVPLPPLSEQLQIIDVLADSMSGCEPVEQELSRLNRQSSAQRQNILRAAFAGQLVPQDPADEPASVLLERIRAGRAAGGAEKKRRGQRATEKA